MGAPVRQRLTPKKRARFLEALAACGNVSEAARAIEMARQSLYDHRSADPAFAAAWDEAAELGADALEDEARRRAFAGVPEPLTCARGLIYDRDGQVVTVQKYSDSLLMFLLKGARPQKYRENLSVTAPAALGVTVVLESMQHDPRYADRANELVRLIASAGPRTADAARSGE